MDSTMHLTPGARLGNYEIKTQLGCGGMGAVYAARHVVLGTSVAIKVLRAQDAADGQRVARLMREGKAAASTAHPNIIEIRDVGVHDRIPYLVMDLLDGLSLGALLRATRRLSVSETVDLMLPVLLAMDAAHRAGVTHRDLKPDNIFLVRDNRGAISPKVLDFGIAKLADPALRTLTSVNTMLGTPHYMAPEQANCTRDADARSDVYSLGVILYECVVGRVPFDGGEMAAIFRAIMFDAPRSLCEQVPGVPLGFERAVMRALAKASDDRQQTTLELARELLPFASTPVGLQKSRWTKQWELRRARRPLRRLITAPRLDLRTTFLCMVVAVLVTVVAVLLTD